jgi:hypothetical protein
MAVCAFVAPYLLPATLRFLTAATEVPGVELAIITGEPVDHIPGGLRARLAGHWRVADGLDPRQIADAVVGLSRMLGPVRRVFGPLEQLQVPLGQVRDALGIDGMDAATAANFRDKDRMKQVLEQHGVPCAAHVLAGSAADARAFADRVGYPLVVKPPAGAGARSTFRLDDPDSLRVWLDSAPPTAATPVVIEQFLVGTEGSFDAVAVDGEVVWYSISEYRPSPLDVLRNPWIQWTVLMPRHIGGPEYDGIATAGPAALRALGLRTGLAHVEWFRLRDGTVAISEAGARPPGAQITTMLGHAHDVDMYRLWAALMTTAEFDAPERRWSVGTAYLRGRGTGTITGVRGLDELQRRLGHLVVESQLPRIGAPTSDIYEGDGHVIVRAPETDTVAAALRELVTGITVDIGPARGIR